MFTGVHMCRSVLSAMRFVRGKGSFCLQGWGVKESAHSGPVVFLLSYVLIQVILNPYKVNASLPKGVSFSFLNVFSFN